MTPRVVPGSVWEHVFATRAPGEAWVTLTLAAPGTSWARGEAAVMALDVDGIHRQEMVLAAGDEPTEYTRSLGCRPAGPHLLRLWIDRSLSAANVEAVDLHAVNSGMIHDADPAMPAWRHAPVLHYRDGDAPLGNASTDTPLVLFYRPVSEPGSSTPLKGIEYHVVFSHEDAGTDLTGLLAKWGHTTDIEWVYRVVWDTSGTITREEFQGPGHRVVPFRGTRALGGHPVLQVSGRHGMVMDRVSCPFRVALTPAWMQPPDEPRESVMHRFPWTYRVSALEVVRQVALEPVADPRRPAPADPRAYLFLQWKRRTLDMSPLEAGVRTDETWYTSAWGRAELAFEGEDAESTAVKLPAGISASDITAIALRAVAPLPTPLEVRLVRAFFLDDNYRPRPELPAKGSATLRAPGTWASVWERR
ncbi:MAG TPA: hypothetical protein VEP50_13630 [bacterium]|nr:hypothetical protein [bacterium]